MLGKKRNKKKKGVRNVQDPMLTIELEDNADEIFRNFIDEFDVFDKDEELLETSLNPTVKQKVIHDVDLHGKTLEEAKFHIDLFVSSLQNGHQGVCELKIITGKGRHSEGPGVLVRHIHEYIRLKYGSRILEIGENPGDLIVNGLPIRGYFRVKIKL